MISALHVLGSACLVPFAQLADFPSGAESPTPEKPDLSLLAPTLRRGLSDVTRAFMHTARLALQQARVAPERVHVVFASAFGEITAAEKLMEQAFDENSASPARFRHSVHNTAPGLFSISVHNQLPSTAIAAGWDTVAMGLLEAESLLADKAEYVLLVFAEERVPPALGSDHKHSPLAVALVLSHAAAEHELGTLEQLRRDRPGAEPDPFAAQNHPLAPAVFLHRALQDGAAQRVRVGDGERPYMVEVRARSRS